MNVTASFRGVIVAAPLKLPSLRLMLGTMKSIPRRDCRGSVEAITLFLTPDEFQAIPRRDCRGSVEASPRVPARTPQPAFRGVIVAAPLKPEGAAGAEADRGHSAA